MDHYCTDIFGCTILALYTVIFPYISIKKNISLDYNLKLQRFSIINWRTCS